MKKVLSLLACSAAALYFTGCASIGTSPKGLESPIEAAALKLVADSKAGGYQLVSSDELQKWYAEKKPMVVVDTMPKEAFEKAHLPGAVLATMPLADKDVTDDAKAALLKAVGGDKEKTVVTYCGFTACRRSHHAAKLLVENGYKVVFRNPAGITGWKEKGFPVEP